MEMATWHRHQSRTPSYRTQLTMRAVPVIQRSHLHRPSIGIVDIVGLLTPTSLHLKEVNEADVASAVTW